LEKPTLVGFALYILRWALGWLFLGVGFGLGTLGMCATRIAAWLMDHEDHARKVLDELDNK